MIVVVWGVSGCGKSTVGKLLADRLGWKFFDADDFHPAANIAKLRQGIALEDEDRFPWLDQLAKLVRAVNDGGQSAVLACSALKQDYRNRLGINSENVLAVHLAGSNELIRARLAQRTHEFMNDALLASQFTTLEPSSTDLKLDIIASPQDLCDQIADALGLPGA